MGLPNGEKGLAFLSVEYLLNLRQNIGNYTHNNGIKSLSIKGSYFEIYNEMVRDLLQNEPGNLTVVENSKDGVYVKDLSVFEISSEDDLRDILTTGNTRRVKASTTRNQFSSRSHAIVQITVEVETLLGGEGSDKLQKTTGKLMLVDLAGSEKLENFNSA